jgi:hypothetical protein
MPTSTSGRLARVLCAIAALLAVSGCASVGRLDFTTHECAATFTRQLADILVSQHETERIAQELARDATLALISGEATTAQFFVFSPSGTDYAFFVQHRSSGCVLRLHARRTLHTELSNDLTYIASRPLTGCRCER